MLTNKKVVVIGGGWAGLSAASELCHRGIKVDLFESNEYLGGRARSITIDDLELDNGPHLLLGAYSETLRLITKYFHRSANEYFEEQPLCLNIDNTKSKNYKSFYLSGSGLSSLISAKGLSLREKLSMAKFLFSLKRRAIKVLDNETVEQLLRRENQHDNVCTLLWYPLCISAMNTPPHKACGRTFLNVVSDALLQKKLASRFLLPKKPLSQTFPEAASVFIKKHGGNIYTRKTVKLQTQTDEQFCVSGELEKYTHAIIASSPHQITNCFTDNELSNAAIAITSNFKYEPICSIYLQYSHETNIQKKMVAYGSPNERWVFDKSYLSPGLICVVLSSSGPHTELTQEDLAETIEQELRDCFGYTTPSWKKVITEKRATFSCVPDLERPPQKTSVKNLYLAGDYTYGRYPATLESAVRSGVNAAKLVLEDM